MIDDIKIDCEVEAENAAPNNSDEISNRSNQTIKKDVDKEYYMIFIVLLVLL